MGDAPRGTAEALEAFLSKWNKHGTGWVCSELYLPWAGWGFRIFIAQSSSLGGSVCYVCG